MKKIKMVGSIALSVSKEEGVCGLTRSASSTSLNKPTLKMEKQKHQGRRGILRRKVNGRSWEMEITHAEFTTAGAPNGRIGPMAITPILVGLASHATEKISLPHLLLTYQW